jgi:hypothetical protein
VSVRNGSRVGRRHLALVAARVLLRMTSAWWKPPARIVPAGSVSTRRARRRCAAARRGRSRRPVRARRRARRRGRLWRARFGITRASGSPLRRAGAVFAFSLFAMTSARSSVPCTVSPGCVAASRARLPGVRSNVLPATGITIARSWRCVSVTIGSVSGFGVPPCSSRIANGSARDARGRGGSAPACSSRAAAPVADQRRGERPVDRRRGREHARQHDAVAVGAAEEVLDAVAGADRLPLRRLVRPVGPLPRLRPFDDLLAAGHHDGGSIRRFGRGRPSARRRRTCGRATAASATRTSSSARRSPTRSRARAAPAATPANRPPSSFAPHRNASTTFSTTIALYGFPFSSFCSANRTTSHIVARDRPARRRRRAVVEQRRGLRLPPRAPFASEWFVHSGDASRTSRVGVAADLRRRQRRHVGAVVVGVREVLRVRLDRAPPVVQPEHELAAGASRRSTSRPRRRTDP